MHGPHVQVEREIPVLVGAFENRAVMHEAGRIDENVERTRPRRRVRRRSSLESTSSLRFSAPSSPSSFATSRSVAQTFAPSRRKAFRDGAPDPLPRRRDEGCLSLKPVHDSPRSALRSMIVARHAEGLRDLLVLHGRLQRHALGELVDHGALDLLPGRLARRIGIAAARLEIGAAPLQLLRRAAGYRRCAC